MMRYRRTTGSVPGMSYGWALVLSTVAMLALHVNDLHAGEYHVRIKVTDTAGHMAPQASVTLISTMPDLVGRAAYDAASGSFTYAGALGSSVDIVVRTEIFPTRLIHLDRPSTEIVESVILDQPGEATAPVDEAMRRYVAYPHVLGVLPATSGQAGDGTTFLDLLRRLGLRPLLEPAELSLAIGSRHLVPVRIMEEGDTPQLLHALRTNALVENAGPIYSWLGTSIRTFTNQLEVKPKPDVKPDEVRALLEKEGLHVESYHTFFAAFTATADDSIGEDITRIAERLMASGKVASADVILFSVPEMDSR